MSISPRTKQLLRWTPAVLFVLTVLYLSTQNVPRMRGNADKLVHFLVYGIMSVLMFWPLSRNGHRYPYVLSVLVALMIGVFDETIQYYNPARVASLQDLLADGLGSWAGGTFFRGIFSVKRNE
jgi:VanZ family protein